ncbi:2-phosphosulfolactate phosphatase [Planctomonas psychrotolerans]|uniref:2-phosphosulfolactate phosphatase n=1 Tax=Planctomonas psychrotolerans TaxID=2528712 RepID=UPI00123977B0|nr:2-phosphosulfolactate phosphatase [Planctomonas psychrotolerans]
MSTTDPFGAGASTDASSRTAPHPHAQSGYQVRFDWGRDGALLLSDASVVVVVDALAFSTTVELAVSDGVEVLPWGVADDDAAAFASARDAVLAGERALPGVVELLPSTVTDALGAIAAERRRVVLASPDGGDIARALADRGVTVVAGSLRNRTAVAEWVLREQEKLGGRATVAVIAAGESRDSGALRPAVEDLLAAGAILDALIDVGIDHCSPEAAAAAAAFSGLRRGIGHLITASASAEEARAAGAADEELARQVDASRTVPVLREFGFRAERYSG